MVLAGMQGQTATVLPQAEYSPLNKIIIHPSLSGGNLPSEWEAPLSQGGTNKVV